MEKRETVYDSLITALWDRADVDVAEDFFGSDQPPDIDSSWVETVTDPNR